MVNTKTKQPQATSEEIYQYVFHNCVVYQSSIKNGSYNSFITLCGYSYKEYAASDIEARAKLANELSKSKYIQNNFKK